MKRRGINTALRRTPYQRYFNCAGGECQVHSRKKPRRVHGPFTGNLYILLSPFAFAGYIEENNFGFTRQPRGFLRRSRDAFPRGKVPSKARRMREQISGYWQHTRCWHIFTSSDPAYAGPPAIIVILIPCGSHHPRGEGVAAAPLKNRKLPS